MADRNITQLVRAEVARLRDEINKDLVRDLEELRSVITKDVLAVMQEEFKRRDSQTKEALDKQIATANNKQLAITKAATKELAVAVSEQATRNAYQMIMKKVNETIIPQINNMVEWVNYNTQDTGELITNYRRAVEQQSHSEDVKLIGSSKGEDKKSWGHNGNIRLYFNDD